MKAKIFLLFVLLSFSVMTVSNEKDVIGERLEKQSHFRVHGWCLVPWGDGYCTGEILRIEINYAYVRILDHSIPITKGWPQKRFSFQEIKPPIFRKCQSLDELILSLKESGTLRTGLIEEAFRKVRRAWFCNETPYFDAAIDIGCGMCISSPHMHIWALELLRDHFSGARNILDVGTGTGYIAAILSYLCPQSKVIGIDCFDLLTHKAEEICSLSLPKELNERIRFVTGNGEKGFWEAAPYDIIHVGFMCEKIPQVLIDQLRPGGRLIIPVSRNRVSYYDPRLSSGKLCVVDKNKDGSIQSYEVLGCSFVPSQVKDQE